MEKKISRRTAMAVGATGAIGVLAPGIANASELTFEPVVAGSVKMWNGYALPRDGSGPALDVTFFYPDPGKSIYISYLQPGAGLGTIRWVSSDLPEPVVSAGAVDHIAGSIRTMGKNASQTASFLKVNGNVYLVLNYDGGGNGWVHFEFIKLVE